MISVRVILAAALSFGSAAGIMAQDYVNTPVSISKEKVRINGKVCYSHVVLERQTLFSISKAYNVSIEDIHKYNPTLKDSGLIKNSILIIPAAETVEPANEVQEEIQNKSPEKVVEPKKVTEPKKARKKTHTVKWYENLDEIAARYGVTAEEIMLANNLSGKKLKSRMKLTASSLALSRAADILQAPTSERRMLLPPRC